MSVIVLPIPVKDEKGLPLQVHAKANPLVYTFDGENLQLTLEGGHNCFGSNDTFSDDYTRDHKPCFVVLTSSDKGYVFDDDQIPYDLSDPNITHATFMTEDGQVRVASIDKKGFGRIDLGTSSDVMIGNGRHQEITFCD